VLERADLTLHVGDFTSLTFLEELQALGPVAGVHGNMDEPAVREAMPGRLVVESEDLRIGLVHDAGGRTVREQRLQALFPDCSVLAYGHTHVPEVKRVGEKWILNPGSPTERRRAPEHTMIVLAEGMPQLVSLDR
jgi:putative phosphoesterase